MNLELQKKVKDEVKGEVAQTYIKENNISISISIMAINTIEPLWELNIAELLSKLRIHQKAHSFPYSFTIVEVMITIKIQHERCICEHSRDSNLVTT